MKLTVENLGSIQAGTIDLAPTLVLITGPNNQGKTWLAWTSTSTPTTSARSGVSSREWSMPGFG
ncbi:MAG: AAA family ATPase [Myxococcales bacterium]|nr:AAA family ATPase [Myxococcales bacterium]